MADKSPAKSKRRIVKNPETFRERAVKASETSDKPKRAARLKEVLGAIVGPVVRPFIRVFAVIFGLAPFRLLGKIIFPAYFRNSWRELKLVTWPDWKQSRQLTFAVLVFAVVFGSVIALVDYGLDKLFKDILLK